MRLRAVTKRPIHPANASGWRRISCPSGTAPRAIFEKRANMIELPRDMADPISARVSESTATTSEKSRPRNSTGRAAITPAKGPAAPMSKSSLLERIGDLILMNAPNVPIGDTKGGAGMK